jgi:citrate synthase
MPRSGEFRHGQIANIMEQHQDNRLIRPDSE